MTSLVKSIAECLGTDPVHLFRKGQIAARLKPHPENITAITSFSMFSDQLIVGYSFEPDVYNTIIPLPDEGATEDQKETIYRLISDYVKSTHVPYDENKLAVFTFPEEVGTVRYLDRGTLKHLSQEKWVVFQMTGC